ncbi:MAG: Zn-ribbon domain-containing OB-fold protein [Candidatus Thorarchaeota archaeon]
MFDVAVKIQASHCDQCNRTIVPPRDVCPYCGKTQKGMTKLEIDRKGTVLSYTTLQMPPDGFDVPLKMALVELNQGAIILCLGHNDEDNEPSIGAKVEIVMDEEARFRFRLLP